jgi:hypothetical protein
LERCVARCPDNPVVGAHARFVPLSFAPGENERLLWVESGLYHSCLVRVEPPRVLARVRPTLVEHRSSVYRRSTEDGDIGDSRRRPLLSRKPIRISSTAERNTNGARKCYSPCLRLTRMPACVKSRSKAFARDANREAGQLEGRSGLILVISHTRRRPAGSDCTNS